jgi:DNA-binding transcriptional LysR family regulator
VDLNLLPALSALLDEQQISPAAERTGLSQSAMSRALQRLRRALGDDLLVRVPGGYRLTARAERVREQLRAVVPQLNEIFTAEAFDPAAAALSLQVSGSDYALATLGLELSRLIVAQSPQSTLRFRPWHEGIFDELALGAVDMAFFGAQAPAQLRSRELFSDRFVCVVADDHPLADRAGLSLAEYLQCRHLAIDIADGRQWPGTPGSTPTPRTAGSATRPRQPHAPWQPQLDTLGH